MLNFMSNELCRVLEKDIWTFKKISGSLSKHEIINQIHFNIFQMTVDISSGEIC